MLLHVSQCGDIHSITVCVCYISYSESLFLQQAELMVALGLRDLGYVQVNIDVSLQEY